MKLTKTAETASTITLSWEPVPGAVGYRFIVDGKMSHTWDATRTSVKVSKGAERTAVEAVGSLDTGTWPQTPTPPDPTEPRTVTPAEFRQLAQPGAVLSQLTVTGPVTIDTAVTVKQSVFQGDVAIQAGTGPVLLEDVTLPLVTVGPTALAQGQNPTTPPAHDITLRRVNGNQFVIGYAHRVRVLGGDWGPAKKAPAIKVFNPWDPPSVVPVDVLVDGAHFHDITQDPGAEHVEGILLYAGNGIVIRNNTFARCRGTGDLSVSFLHLNPWNPLIANVLVEGNRGSTEPGTNEDGGFFNVQYDGQIPGLVMRNNTWPKSILNVNFVPYLRDQERAATSELAAGMTVRADLEAAWAEWLKPTNPNGKRSQGEAWRRDNPGEWAKLDAYRKGGVRPTLSSNTGRQMVCETDAWHGTEIVVPPIPPAGCQVDRATMTAPGCKLLRSDTGTNANPEPGLWGSIEAVSDSRHQHFTSGGDPGPKADGTSQGDSAYRRMTVNDGDDFYGERAELGRNWWQNGENTGTETDGAFALAREGDRKLTFWSMRFPSGFPIGVNAWQQIGQWKQAQPYDTPNTATRNPDGNGVTVELQMYANRFRLHTWWQERWSTPAPPLDRWIRFATDITFSQWPDKGKVQVFIDNDADGDFLDPDEMSPIWQGATLLYATAAQNGLAAGESIPSMLALGIYHNPAAYGTTSVEIDNVQVMG